MIAIYTLTSSLHDEHAVDEVTREFLSSLKIDYVFCGSDYSDYGSHALDLIYVRTGGTEGILKGLLPSLLKQSRRPFYLLTSGKSNSLAASMEILSYLRQQGLQGEILHGEAPAISHRIQILSKVGAARALLRDCRLGVIGAPSDWLISSTVDKDIVKGQLGIELVDIPMQELLDELQSISLPTEQEVLAGVAVPSDTDLSPAVREAMPGAWQIYKALKVLIERYHLKGFTLRCFDLLTAVHNTGCLALAKLNSEGYVAGCEGDIPTMLTMMMTRSLVGVSGFQANPAYISPSHGEMLFAHCTIPFNMTEHAEFDTHYESGIGVGIRGYMAEGPVTIFKLSGNLSRHFIEEGTLLRSQAEPNLCRTQQVIRLSNPAKTSYFLTDPIGNHHVILPGHHRELLEEFCTILTEKA